MALKYVKLDEFHAAELIVSSESVTLSLSIGLPLPSRPTDSSTSLKFPGELFSSAAWLLEIAKPAENENVPAS